MMPLMIKKFIWNMKLIEWIRASLRQMPICQKLPTNIEQKLHNSM